MQTDNGTEITNRLKGDKLTLFEVKLKFMNIKYRPIRPVASGHNGNVES